MCGIIGYSGHRPAIPLIMEGLHSLEYRGYDSSGVAYVQAGTLRVVRAEGRLNALEEKLAHNATTLATVGIGHTRWATHGEPVERNAHPHLAGESSIALAHNGIIENYQEIKAELLAEGYSFLSETDTEVLACLIAHEAKTAPHMTEAFARAMRRTTGASAVIMMTLREPNVVYGARLCAPLLLGVGTGENFLASDIPAFLSYTREVVFLEDGEMARIDGQHWDVLRLEDLAPVGKRLNHIPWDMQAAQKDGYKHFMLKEIMEQPRVIVDCLAGRVDMRADNASNSRLTANNACLRPFGDKDSGESLQGISSVKCPEDGAGRPMVRLPELDDLPVPERLHIVACGTSYHAGLWARQFIESRGGIPTDVEIASEFRYRDPILEPRDMVLVISQSGETADTLHALRLARRKGCTVMGICNAMGSSIAREADAVLYTQAGPEISVASTKAMCSQMVLLMLLALYFGQRREPVRHDAPLLEALLGMPTLLEGALPAMRDTAKRLAGSYSDARSFFYLGRGPSFALALEGALKLKELSYIHAEGYASGEMKHGPIALIDPEFPTFALALNDPLLPKVVSNIVEVQARRGKVIALVQSDTAGANKKSGLKADDTWVLPACHPDLGGLLALPALQLFSYEMADYLGKDVDQPRNLAKSVTVE